MKNKTRHKLLKSKFITINEQDRLFHAKIKATYLKLCSLDSCILAFFTCKEKTVWTRLLRMVLVRISTRSSTPADPAAASQHRKPRTGLQCEPVQPWALHPKMSCSPTGKKGLTLNALASLLWFLMGYTATNG